ncbi:MAG: chromosome segregation protein SMC, partial [Armatimonadetes bacterium]|nr:chromosome segregation protein SMC [Armatimonadota bacterium]
AINGLECRLRDVQMLFLGTGLGGRSYALIGQGEVDAVLRATPPERRQWLEEAAGLARHKRQRVEAERRLGHAQAHLERLGDVAAELEAQQQALAAQAEAAARHRSYTEELTELELALYADEARRLLGAVRRLGAQLSSDRDAVAVGSERVAAAAAAVAAAEARLAEVTADWERGQQALLEGAERSSALAAEVQAASAQVDALRARGQYLAADAERLEQALERLRAEAAGLRAEAGAAERERAELVRAVADAEARAEASGQDAASAQTRLVQVHAEAVEVGRTFAQTQNDLAAWRARAEMLAQSVQATAEKTLALDRAAEALARERRAAEQAADAARQAAQDAEARIADCARTVGARREALASLVDQVHAVELDEHRLRDRLAALEEARDQFAGFEEGARAVLLAARAEPARFPGLRGAVADLLEVSQEYRPAVAAALGGRLHGLVVHRQEQIDAVIQCLDAHGPAGATVLALDALRPRRPEPEHPAGGRAAVAAESADGACADGVRARAMDVAAVSAGGIAPDLARRLAEILLGDVVIVNDLRTAWMLISGGFQGRVVTRDGTLLEPDGIVTVRGWTHGEMGPLGRSQAIAGLREAVGRIEARRADLAARRAAAAEQVAAAEADLAAARDDGDRVQAGLTECMGRLERFALDAARLEEDRASLSAEDRRRAEALRDLQTDIQRLEAQARQLEAEARRLADMEAGLQADAARIVARRAAASAEVTAKRVALAALDGRLQALAARLTDREAAMDDLAHRRADMAGEHAGIMSNLAAGAERLARAAAAHEALLAAQAAAKADIEHLNAERARLRDEVAVRQAEHLAAEAGLREAEASLHRTEIRHAQAEAELGAAASRLASDFGVTLEEAAARRLQGGREEALRRAEEVRVSLRELGAVNLRAIEEHAAVTARLEALRAQIADLQAAGEALRGAITHINAALRVRFRETFEDVDREFGRLFQRLFEGGSGHLELVEMEDGSEPGLEVTAQLPGKARRPLVALSGGERVLVALALIFAMLRVHPSPFCIFDEVEAALDDVNTKRFCTLLRDLAEQTQVLIITHNKGTMAAADILYGVTMQEPGISSLVSVRLVASTNGEAPHQGAPSAAVAVARAARDGEGPGAQERETASLPAE